MQLISETSDHNTQYPGNHRKVLQVRDVFIIIVDRVWYCNSYLQRYKQDDYWLFDYEFLNAIFDFLVCNEYIIYVTAWILSAGTQWLKQGLKIAQIELSREIIVLRCNIIFRKLQFLAEFF